MKIGIIGAGQIGGTLTRRACEPIAFEEQEVMRSECHANATAARS